MKRSIAMTTTTTTKEQREVLVAALSARLEEHDDNRRAFQERLSDACSTLKRMIDEMEERVNTGFEAEFKAEDERLQSVLSKMNAEEEESEVLRMIQRARAELLVKKSYELGELSTKEAPDLSQLYSLKTRNEVVLEWVSLSKPTNLRVDKVERGKVYLEFNCLNADEERVLEENSLRDSVVYIASLRIKGNERDAREYSLKHITGNNFSFALDPLEPETTYLVQVKGLFQGKESEWSDEAEFATDGFKECCVWKECPDNIKEDMRYSVDEENPKIVRNTDRFGCRTIIGNTSLPLNQVTSWNIKLLKSKYNDGNGLRIGIVPSDIGQNELNIDKCGWYFDCFDSMLYSGPPHKFWNKIYGPRKGPRKYIRTKDSAGVVMDTAKGELSFVLNGVNLGVAYEGIPLDKPLVPCVLIYCGGDSVELDLSEVKENEVDRFIPIPSNVRVKRVAWDSITLAWDAVEGASFYQIEVNGSKTILFTETSFTKKELLPKTEYTLRVRVMNENVPGKWSGVVKGKTQNKTLEHSIWKECPEIIDMKRKYYVDENNPRIATKVNCNYGGSSTIIGNTPLSLNKVSSWSIRILRSRDNNGGGTQIGIAPSDIDQNIYGEAGKSGWYFDCFYSVLFSGPPHNYRSNEYGPRKKNGQYVHNGDNVGVVMDTAKGELSFVLKGANLGVAYEGVPLDKPLVPCVILYCNDDSVELVT